MLLIGFASILQQTAPPQPELKPLEARIVEIPIGGLQAGGGAMEPAAPKLAPRPIVKPKIAMKPRHEKMAPPPVPTSPEGTLKGKESESASVPPPSRSGTSSGTAAEPGAGEGGRTGFGSDSIGARALYAPVPQIPDDMRDEIIQAEAIAHFTVSFDGAVTVVLSKPTDNPRLNQILLETLKQWKFFPAVKDGVAINSAFDVRIPVTVR